MLRNLGDRRPSAAMIVASLALFVALGGVSVAALKLKPNSVKAKNLKSGAVTEPKIRNGAVTEPKIGAEAVSTAKIAGGAVTGGKIAEGAVSAGKLAAGSVTKAKFAVSGTATNTNNFTLQNSCTVATFSAPGVQPGDVVSFSFRDAPTLNGLLVAQPAEDEVTTNTLKLQLCEVTNVQANITTGSVVMDFVAIR